MEGFCSDFHQLQSVKLPHITTWHTTAFSNCPSLAEILVPKTPQTEATLNRWLNESNKPDWLAKVTYYDL